MKERKRPSQLNFESPVLQPHRRIAVIVSPGSSEWASCNTISQNLQLAYKLAETRMEGTAKFEYFQYSESMSNRTLASLATKILSRKYSNICFLDHWPLPYGLVCALTATAKGRPLPGILIHLYGDFTYYSPDMFSTFYLLRGRKFRPVCASHRQVNLISSLVKAPKESIGHCPFPVDTRTFFPDAALRDKERRALGWRRGDFVLLYTGRISLQKNVTLAIEQAFAEARRTKGKNWKGKFHFVLAGKYDDLGAPFFGKSPLKNDYYFKIRALMSKVDPALGSLTFLGHLPPKKLNKIYNAADGFISLSLHHDEDYGMSPAEALACGLPCLLSDWGGYPSFTAVNTPASSQVWLAPAASDRRGLYFPLPELRRAFAGLFSASRSMEARAETARRFVGEFGIAAAAHKITREILATETSTVTGLKAGFVELTKRTLAVRKGDRSRIYKSYRDPLYQRVYSAYRGPEMVP